MSEHISSATFGDNISAKDNLIALLHDRVFDTDPLTYTILARESYETQFKIRDHRKEKNPFRAYLASDVERIEGVGGWEYYAAKFVEYGVMERCGISLDAFMKLPMHRAEFLLELTEKVFMQEKKVIDANNNQK